MMEMRTAAMAPTSERRLGRYTLFGEIASGGMATVHVGRLAGEGGFSRIVAIKCLHRHLADDPEFRAMFLDEARLAARIQHPNVVSTVDVGTSEQGMFLVTEYVVGESLASLVRASAERGERILASIAVRILIDTLNGLHAAHVATDDAGTPLSIVHRDVSPQNILVGTDGLARVIDFGIAKAATSSHTTREGQLKGKLRYMAPEQFKDAGVSPQTDIYAASVVLWELLTGERLFGGSNDAAIMGRVLEGVVAPASKLAPGVSRELDAIVQRGLARDPRDRFGSAQQMAEALEGTAPTTGRQVGVWVERVVGDVLRKRAAMIEGSHVAPDEAHLAPPARHEPVTKTNTVAPSPERNRARSGGATTLLVSAGAVLLAALAFVGMRAFGGSRPGAPVVAANEIEAASVASAAPEVPSATTQADPTPDDETPAPARPASSGRPATRPPPVRTRKPPSPAGAGAGPSCNPPYYEDPTGIRRVKPQCL
jgi:hypothetical protein